MSNSPWGAIQYSQQIVRGVRQVNTASHGGIMITERFARKNLSNSALKRALIYGPYYCYEEDCDYAIALFEIHDNSKKNELIETLSLYNADYLLEKGIAPVEPQYTYYKESKLRDKLANEKSPDLIVCAWGSWKTKQKDIILVATADGKLYHIKETGYSDLRLKLLSKCQIIEQVIEMY